ncbi:hypothetical protein N9M63_00185 [Candidatus Pelagibacter bacterium]|jgi:hypothetical protein|nr:hypothetical protein [Candidatus Pelagibacter bacterium]MDC1223954.1 hypothetical protein [Pelagibacteraceae bacterium]|tara:strand:+ start:832 stop:1098 length:267 start_codon:yes stop_codon:yes gene_type:complete
MNEKQKKFKDKFYRLGDWHYKEVKTKVLELLDNCELTKKELDELLNGNVSQFTNDEYLYDEIIDNVYENEESGYYVINLKDDDVVKKR